MWVGFGSDLAVFIGVVLPMQRLAEDFECWQ